MLSAKRQSVEHIRSLINRPTFSNAESMFNDILGRELLINLLNFEHSESTANFLLSIDNLNKKYGKDKVEGRTPLEVGDEELIGELKALYRNSQNDIGTPPSTPKGLLDGVSTLGPPKHSASASPRSAFVIAMKQSALLPSSADPQNFSPHISDLVKKIGLVFNAISKLAKELCKEESEVSKKEDLIRIYNSEMAKFYERHPNINAKKSVLGLAKKDIFGLIDTSTFEVFRAGASTSANPKVQQIIIDALTKEEKKGFEDAGDLAFFTSILPVVRALRLAIKAYRDCINSHSSEISDLKTMASFKQLNDLYELLTKIDKPITWKQLYENCEKLKRAFDNEPRLPDYILSESAHLVLALEATLEAIAVKKMLSTKRRTAKDEAEKGALADPGKKSGPILYLKQIALGLNSNSKPKEKRSSSPFASFFRTKRSSSTTSTGSSSHSSPTTTPSGSSQSSPALSSTVSPSGTSLSSPVLSSIVSPAGSPLSSPTPSTSSPSLSPSFSSTSAPVSASSSTTALTYQFDALAASATLEFKEKENAASEFSALPPPMPSSDTHSPQRDRRHGILNLRRKNKLLEQEENP